MKYTKHILVFVCLAPMAIASVFGHVGYNDRRGDANGDRCVNILDVQKVVSQVLHGPDGKTLADVNHDGDVDIRDLQYVLHCAEKSRSEKDAEPTDTDRGKATVGSPGKLYAKARVHTHFIIAADGDSETPDFRSVDFPLVTCDTQVERYLFTLTSHAPPLYA